MSLRKKLAEWIYPEEIMITLNDWKQSQDDAYKAGYDAAKNHNEKYVQSQIASNGVTAYRNGYNAHKKEIADSLNTTKVGTYKGRPVLVKNLDKPKRKHTKKAK